MTTQTVQGLSVTPAPSVNLLPPEIAEAARFRRFQLAMGCVVAASAVIVGLLYTGARHDVADAQSTLATAQAQQASLQSQVAGLQAVADTYQQVANAKALLAQAMGSEVRWSYYLEDLSLRIPDTVWLTSMSVAPASASTTTTTTTPGAAATPPVVAPSDQVATITFSGVALSRDDVAKWLTAIAAEKGWADPYVTSITEASIGTRKVFDWNGTVYVTSAALSNRYTQAGS